MESVVVPIENLTLELFSPRVGEVFEIILDDDAVVPVTLCEATALRVFEYPGRNPNRHPFQIQFGHPLAPVFLPQRIYRLRNAVLGLIEICLVPIGPNGEDFRYQALFN
jgi:hypothetical protein